MGGDKTMNDEILKSILRYIVKRQVEFENHTQGYAPAVPYEIEELLK